MDFTVRKYTEADLQGVRDIYGDDEFARPRLEQKFPRMKEYLADEVSYYYTHYEPESVFVAEVEGQIVGALLGAKDTPRQEKYTAEKIKPYLRKRCLSGAYGWPIWLYAAVLTDLAGRSLKTPEVDLRQYPAHLHIGILPAWRRKGIGVALMDRYAGYLRQNGIPGYHLYAASFHPLGVAFYRKLGLEDLGQFNWRFHDGYQWLEVTEFIFGQKLDPLPGPEPSLRTA